MYIKTVTTKGDYRPISNMPQNILLISEHGTIAIRDDRNVVFFSGSSTTFAKITECCNKYKIFSGQLILENP